MRFWWVYISQNVCTVSRHKRRAHEKSWIEDPKGNSQAQAQSKRIIKLPHVMSISTKSIKILLTIPTLNMNFRRIMGVVRENRGAKKIKVNFLSLNTRQIIYYSDKAKQNWMTHHVIWCLIFFTNAVRLKVKIHHYSAGHGFLCNVTANSNPK